MSAATARTSTTVKLCSIWHCRDTAVATYATTAAICILQSTGKGLHAPVRWGSRQPLPRSCPSTSCAGGVLHATIPISAISKRSSDHEPIIVAMLCLGLRAAAYTIARQSALQHVWVFARQKGSTTGWSPTAVWRGCAYGRAFGRPCDVTRRAKGDQNATALCPSIGIVGSPALCWGGVQAHLLRAVMSVASESTQISRKVSAVKWLSGASCPQSWWCAVALVCSPLDGRRKRQLP